MGERWLRFIDLGPEMKTQICKAIPIQTLVVCWDSLKTNMAVLRGLRNASFRQQKERHQQTHCSPLLSVRCSLHLIALCRKPVLFQWKGHWSSIVRLAHLFETHSFRRQFHLSLLRVIGGSFAVVPIAELPLEHTSWQEERNRASGILNDDPSYPCSRLALYRQLFKYDNGDPCSLTFTHFCMGDCCQGKTAAERQKFALIQISKLYSSLFSTGFAVPLTYRWLKAHPALRYVKEGCLLHKILPRTLEQLSLSNPCDPEKEAELLQLLEQNIEDGMEGDDREWEGLLLNVHNTGDFSPAEINQKRKQLTFQTFRQPDFGPKCILMDYMMSPLVSGMDELLKRTGAISKLHQLSTELDLGKRDELVTRTEGLAFACTSFSSFECGLAFHHLVVAS